MRHWTRAGIYLTASGILLGSAKVASLLVAAAAGIYLTASGILLGSAKVASLLVAAADRLDDEQWFARYKGSIVRITKHGVSTLERK